MNDRIRQALSGLCAAGAFGLVAGFLYLWPSGAVQDIGGVFAFLGGATALASLISLALELRP
jgi:hypothetical protein